MQRTKRVLEGFSRTFCNSSWSSGTLPHTAALLCQLAAFGCYTALLLLLNCTATLLTALLHCYIPDKAVSPCTANGGTIAQVVEDLFSEMGVY